MTNRKTGIKFSRTLITRLPRLLWMRYTVPELARELNCKPSQIRTLLTHGCPHERDEKGKAWITGTDFAAWAQATLTRNRHPLGPGQAWCCRCNSRVTMLGPLNVRPTTAHLELVSGTCAICGQTVNRGRARRRANSD